MISSEGLLMKYEAWARLLAARSPTKGVWLRVVGGTHGLELVTDGVWTAEEDPNVGARVRRTHLVADTTPVRPPRELIVLKPRALFCESKRRF